MAQVPITLMPRPGEMGLLAYPELLAESTGTAWSEFVRIAKTADLEAKPRGSMCHGRDVVLHLGDWPEQRHVRDITNDAINGVTGDEDRDSITRAILGAHHDVSNEAAIAALEAARDAMIAWWDSPAAQELAAAPVSSALGTLPLATWMHASAYQLALSALDLRPCGAVVSELLMDCGLTALVDVTGALAAREGITGTITAVTPTLTIGFGASDGHWRTGDPDEPAPGVSATSEIILDVTSGRADVVGLYRRGDLTVRDLPALMPLAPIVTNVPGIPGGAALRQAITMMSAVSGLLSKFPFGRR